MEAFAVEAIPAALLHPLQYLQCLRSLPCMSRELNDSAASLGPWGRSRCAGLMSIHEYPQPLRRRREGRQYARGWGLPTQQIWFHGGDHGNMPLSEICFPIHPPFRPTVGACNGLNALQARGRQRACVRDDGRFANQSPAGIILDGMAQVSAPSCRVGPREADQPVDATVCAYSTQIIQS